MSGAVVIDRARALALLREVVTEHGPDTRYDWQQDTRCLYAREGRPACIVGQALFRAGIPVETLAAMDECPVSGIGHVQAPALSGLTEQGRRVFEAAQRLQDAGQTWGAALANAEKAV